VRRCLSCGTTFADGWRCPSCGFEPAPNGFPDFVTAVGDTFPEESFDLLARLEESSFWFRARNELIGWALGRYFPRGRSFLEVGCGTGFVLRGLRERRPELALAGGEPFIGGLEVARSRLPDVPLYRLDGANLPFEDEFDVVGAFDVLEHVEDDRAVLRELHRAVKPGGGVLLTVPQHPRLWSAVDDFSRHLRRYTRAELVEKSRAAGFRPVRATSFVSVLLPLLLLSRLRGRNGDEPYDPETEYRLPPAVDAVLERVLAGERALIKRGVSFPAGGSLLLVARA
jgi:SAM-dependent methyltransferase